MQIFQKYKIYTYMAYVSKLPCVVWENTANHILKLAYQMEEMQLRIPFFKYSFGPFK